MSQFTQALDLVERRLAAARRNRRPWRAEILRLAGLRAARPAGRDAAAVSEPSLIVAETHFPTQLPTPVVVVARLLTDPARSRPERLAQLASITAVCQKCPHLASSRTKVVFGVGNPDAELMFVGEAPGADEDASGEPFVGRAGQLLTKIIEVMGYQRGDVYISNILKCRPDTPGQTSGNRPPRPEEMSTCLPYLVEQIDIIRPKVIVGLGSTAARGLLGVGGTMGAIRGKWHDFRGTPVMMTYHPSFLLRPTGAAHKRTTWEDMLLVKERMGQEISARERRYFLSKPVGEDE